MKKIVCSTLLVLFLCSISSSFGYGERIGLPEGTAFTSDFVDSDGDGVDDRHQRGPGQPPVSNDYIGLPKVDYYGGVEHRGVADLRFGVRLYQEWLNLRRNRPSQLEMDPIPIPYEDPRLQRVLMGKESGLRFRFPAGIEIFTTESGSFILFFSGDTVIPIPLKLKVPRDLLTS